MDRGHIEQFTASKRMHARSFQQERFCHVKHQESKQFSRTRHLRQHPQVLLLTIVIISASTMASLSSAATTFRMEEEFKEQDEEANESSTSLRQQVTAEVSIVPLQSHLDHQSKMQSLLPMGNLRFDRLGIVGRTKELQQLREAVPYQKQESNALVILSGLSGTGKTKLALSLRDSIEKHGGLFCQGKFQSSNGAPYAGIAAAFNQACAMMVQQFQKHETKHSEVQLRRQLWKEIDAPQMELLLRIIPQLAVLAHGPAKESVEDDNGYMDFQQKKDARVLEIDQAIEREDSINEKNKLEALNNDSLSSTSIMLYEYSQNDLAEEQQEQDSSHRSATDHDDDDSSRKDIHHLGPNVSSDHSKHMPPKKEKGIPKSDTILEEKPRRNLFGFRRRQQNNKNKKSPLADEAAVAFALRQPLQKAKSWRNHAKSPAVSNDPSTATHEPATTPQASKELMERALLSLLGLLVNETKGQMVWLLDDLQWVDSSSLGFLETLLTQEDFPITVITTHRSDHVESKEDEEAEDHHWKQATERLLAKSDSVVQVTEISIGTLDVAEVHQVLCDLLSVAPEDAHAQTYELAKLVHKRTLGNFYHVNVSPIESKHFFLKILFDALFTDKMFLSFPS